VQNFPVIYYDRHAKFRCCVPYCVGACRMCEKFGVAVAQSRWIEIVPDPVETCPHASPYRIGRSTSNGMGSGSILEKLWGRWCSACSGWGRDCWPRRNTPLLHMLSCQVRSFQVKRYNRNYVDPSEKLAPSVPPFKVIQGYWNRHGSIRCLWLPTSDPLYSRAYLVAFPRWKAISVESRKVFPPRVTLPQRKFPLDFFLGFL